MFTQGDDNLLEIKPEHYLTGEKFGSWFGCAIAVADLNNDGYVVAWLAASRKQPIELLVGKMWCFGF